MKFILHEYAEFREAILNSSSSMKFVSLHGRVNHLERALVAGKAGKAVGL